MDGKLTFGEHIQRGVMRCKKAINVMRCLAGSSWGASMKSLKQMYIAIIRSALDYACIAYGSAAKSHLTKCDVIQAQAIRLCCGAFKTSSVAALQVEVGELPLYLRRMQLSMVYWTNLHGHKQDHPTKSVLEPCWEHGRTKLNSFGWVGDSSARELGISNLTHSCTVPLPATPPWLFPMPTVDLQIIKKSKQCNEFGGMNSLIQQYIIDKYNGSIQIFTDGSKDPDTGRTEAAVHIPQFNVSIIKRTSDHLAVFTVELLAILLALWWIEEGRSSRCIICSDSMAALISISNGKSTCRPDLVYEVQCFPQ